jgi:hypothetical protein
MKKTTFLKKAKKLGLTVDEPNDGRRCYIHHNGNIASWFWQENWQTGELEGTNWHIKGEGQESDPYTDYFPGYFTDNATQMLNRLVPPGSKYKVGSLVRCKDNKRSTRYNRVGRMGLIVYTGQKQAKIRWIKASEGELRLQELYPNTYGTGGVFTEWVQDNDLEIISAAS